MTSSDALPGGRRYPVISVSLEAAQEALGERGRPFDFPGQGRQALAAVNERKRKPVEVTVWAREGPGYDRVNRPARLVFLFVVARRGGGKIAETFWKELNRRWADQCRMEGSYAPVGDERPLWELDANGARNAS